jgi:hypothetical protein
MEIGCVCYLLYLFSEYDQFLPPSSIDYDIQLIEPGFVAVLVYMAWIKVRYDAQQHALVWTA